MKNLILVTVMAAFLTPMGSAPAQAGTMSKACMKSDRPAKSRRLCNCIQQVADQTLTGNDQRLAASFFKDPHRSQEIRQSDRSGHERFWLRYKDFGSVAMASCGHLIK